MRTFKEYEKDYLEQFLAAQPTHEISVMKLGEDHPKVSAKVLENYLEFNKSGISVRLNCAYTDHVEQVKGSVYKIIHYISCEINQFILEIIDCPMPPFAIFIGKDWKFLSKTF